MNPQRRAVKRARAYDATGRKARAREQHAAVLDAARAMFLQDGYAATTVDAIAESAGVSSATIYKTYGGKAGLVRELCQRALAGAGQVHAETRSNALRSSDDPRAVVEGWGRLATEVAPRGAPLYLLLRAAAINDAEAAALCDDLDRARLRRMADNARFLVRAGFTRSGVTAKEARDVLWLCSSPELYDLLVTRRGWSLSRFGRFVADTISGSLL